MLARRSSALLGTLLACLLAGCGGNAVASAEARARMLLSSTPPPPGRVCSIVTQPEALPSADRLVDVGRLLPDLVGLARRGSPADAFVLFSMGYDQFGTNIRRSIIEHNLEAAAADSVQRLVFANRKALGEAEAPWGVRLRIELADPVRLQVGRQEVCAAKPLDSRVALGLASQYSASIRDRVALRQTTVWLRLAVDPRGVVTGAEVERGILRGPMMEHQVLDRVRGIVFEPALADGTPVSSFVSVPIRIPER